MQCAFFTIPIKDTAEAQDELNIFLRSHRILSVQKEFVTQGDNSFWSLAVEYLNGTANLQAISSRRKAKIDYREVLSEEDFAVYSKLRELRKSIADAEGVPVYTIFTNDQLAEMVTKKVDSKTEMATIGGVGEAKLAKYAERFLEILRPGMK